MEHWAAIALGALGFIINIIVLVAAVTWKLSRVEMALREALKSERKEIDEQVTDLRILVEQTRREIYDQAQMSARSFGETVVALREKVQLFELWSRDNFARREGVDKMRTELTESLRDLAKDIKERLSRMEEKIDDGKGGHKKAASPA